MYTGFRSASFQEDSLVVPGCVVVLLIGTRRVRVGVVVVATLLAIRAGCAAIGGQQQR